MAWEDHERKVLEAIDKITSIGSDLDAIRNQSDGRENLIQGFKTELGDIKKAMDELKSSGGDEDKMKDLVDKIDELSNNINSSSEKGSQGGAEADQEWDEKKLSKAAKEKADEVFKSLSPEQKADIKADPEKRKEFLKAAQEATATAPDSLFDEHSGNEEPTPTDFKKLFSNAEQDANHVPGVTQRSKSGFAGADRKGEQTTEIQPVSRLVNGEIPRPKKDSPK